MWGRYWARNVQLVDESTEDFQKMLEDMDMPAVKKDLGFACSLRGKQLGNK